MATIQRLEEVASILGPDETIFFSQDDKARVPIGLTAAKKQAPILMLIEYRVMSLPDHDCVVAERHKLIPSVMTAIEIGRDVLGRPDVVGYSGSSFVAIRAGKHSSSTVLAHGIDLQRLLELPEFEALTKTETENSVKPIVIFTVDGGPDENPRYQAVVSVAIHT